MRFPVEEEEDETIGEFSDAAGGTVDDGDIIQLLDLLEAQITESARLPGSRRLLIDPETYVDLLDRMRRVGQNGIREARSVVRMRDTLLADAKALATQIVDEAERRAAVLLSDDALYEAGRQESARMVNEAEARADRTIGDAEEYASQILVSLRDHLGRLREALLT